MDTASRLLQMLSLLHERPQWSGAELASRLEVTARTVRRDIARLRALGHAVEAITGPDGGYRLVGGSDVPPLAFDEQEVLAVALALQTADHPDETMVNASASAFAKLQRVLPERLAQEMAAIDESTVQVAGWRPDPVDPHHLLVLAQACRERHRVRFAYVDTHGARTLRTVDPERLVRAGARWYLVAFDLERDDWRTFRCDRLRAAVTTGQAAADRIAPDVVELVQRGRTAAFVVEAEVVIHANVEDVRRVIPRYAGSLDAQGPQATMWRIGGRDAPQLAAWIATVPFPVEVRAPDEVVRAFHDHLRRLQALPRQ